MAVVPKNADKLDPLLLSRALSIFWRTKTSPMSACKHWLYNYFNVFESASFSLSYVLHHGLGDGGPTCRKSLTC